MVKHNIVIEELGEVEDPAPQLTVPRQMPGVGTIPTTAVTVETMFMGSLRFAWGWRKLLSKNNISPVTGYSSTNNQLLFAPNILDISAISLIHESGFIILPFSLTCLFYSD